VTAHDAKTMKAGGLSMHAFELGRKSSEWSKRRVLEYPEDELLVNLDYLIALAEMESN
jgi:hypothetical protein